MPFPDDSFEVVLCQNGIQFVLDKSVVLHPPGSCGRWTPCVYRVE
jgi:hypothetical protein